MANLVTYAKQKWEDAKTAITAARLNNMEQGINDCATQINALGDSVSRRLGRMQDADYAGMAWLVIGKSEDDVDRRGLAWSDNELDITRGGKHVARIKLTPVGASSDQVGPELS